MSVDLAPAGTDTYVRLVLDRTSGGNNRFRPYLITVTRGAPSPPRNVRVTAGDQSATLTWDPPSSWGPGHTRRYLLESKPSSSTVISAWREAGRDGADFYQPSTVTSYIFTGPQARVLQEYENGRSYDFRITPTTLKSGTDGSNASDWLQGPAVVVTATPRAATSKPGAVTDLTATPGDGSIYLSWTPPSGAVSGRDIHYTTSTAVANDAAGSTSTAPATGWKAVPQVTSPARPDVFLGLNNGSTYRIRVRVVNSAGYGPWAFVGATPAATTTPTAQWARSSVTVTETDEDRLLNLRIVLSKVLTGAATLTVTQADAAAAGAAGSADWSKVAGACAEGASGDRFLTCAITIKGDDVAESDETLKLSMSVGSGTIAVGARSTITVTIRDDDVPAGTTLSGLTATSSTSATGTFTALDIGTFSSGTRDYTATVHNSVTHVKLTPTVAAAGATVKVGKGSSLTAVASGSASGAIALDAGANAITVEVTAADGTTTGTYTVTVTRRQAATPAAPSNLYVGGGNTKLILSWTAPAGTVTGYDVHYTSAAKATVTDNAAVQTGAASAGWKTASHTGTTAAQTISSLTNATAYRVRVRAKNSLGAGVWVFGAGTPAGVLDAPTALSAGSGDRSLALTWTAPTGTVTGYDVQYTSASAAIAANGAAVQTGAASAGWKAVSRTGATASQTISGLTNGTVYRVRVRAVNAGGHGVFAFDTGTPTTPVVTFEAATLSDGEGQTLPVYLALNPYLVTDSTINVRVDPASTASSDEYTGLANFSALQAENSRLAYNLTLNNDTVNEPDETVILNLEAITNAPYRLGTQKTLTITITDNDPPAAPTGLTLAGAGSQGISARWNKPAGPVTAYRMRYKEASATDQDATTPLDPSSGWVTWAIAGDPTATSTQITGLTQGTAYHVQVRATDGQTGTGNGFGSWSTSATGTAANPNTPGAPTDFRALPNGPGELRISWQSPVHTLGGVRLTGCCRDHELHYTTAAESAVGDSAAASGTDASTAWVKADFRRAVITGLTNGTEHRLRGRVHNAVGPGAWAFTTGTPQAQFDATAPAVRILRPWELHELQLVWDDPMAGRTIAGYHVHYTTAAESAAANDAAAVSGTDPAAGWVDATRTGRPVHRTGGRENIFSFPPGTRVQVQAGHGIPLPGARLLSSITRRRDFPPPSTAIGGTRSSSSGPRRRWVCMNPTAPPDTRASATRSCGCASPPRRRAR